MFTFFTLSQDSGNFLQVCHRELEVMIMNTILRRLLLATASMFLFITTCLGQDLKPFTGQVAAWNLAGRGGIPATRLARQVEGLALLDAEVIALVEISPPSALDDLKQGLIDMGVCYDSALLPQVGNELHIGVLFKCGVEAGTPKFIPG